MWRTFFYSLLGISLFMPMSLLTTEASRAETPMVSDTPHKKLIELGWDIPDTAFLRQNYTIMEQTTPFDGVIYELAQVVPSDGQTSQKQSSQWLWDAAPWERQTFQPAIDDLQSCAFQQFTDNFIRINFSPATVAWNDDDGWKTIMQKVALCAWVAKTSGCTKGLAPDFESYGSELFRYHPDSGLSFQETVAFSRRRGAEFVTAIASEYPDAIVLCLWMNSINVSAGRNDTPETILESAGYGLLPAFINGMLDAAPRTMRFVDGCENGYYYDGEEAYARSALDMLLWTGPAMRLIAPENRTKYRTQVQAGFGFYLDMYSNPKGNHYYREAHEGETRFDRMTANLDAALSASDEYVWVYGEKYRWWTSGTLEKPAFNPDPEPTLWQEFFPGVSDAFWAIKNPRIAGKRALQTLLETGTAENLLTNPDFREPTSDGNQPLNWGNWQHEKTSHGTFGWEKRENGVGGAAVMRNVEDGCFIQAITIQPNGRYAVTATAKLYGNGQPRLVVRWQTSDGAWCCEDRDATFVAEVNEIVNETSTSAISGANPIEMNDPDTNPVEREYTMTGYVKVPTGAGKMVLLLSIAHQRSDADRCAFENAAIYLID